MEYFTIKNWRVHQHYKNRNDPWIKLHIDLLSDYEFGLLSNDSKLILIHIWLLSSKLGVDEPKIPNDIKWICRQTNLEGRFSLKELFDNGFIRMIQNDSIEIQDCIGSTKINIKKININKSNINKIENEEFYDCISFFEEDWKKYPRKAGDKKKAKKCYLKTVVMWKNESFF